MNQEELLEKLHQSAGAVPTPEGLAPDLMMKRLEGMRPKGSRFYQYGAAAAVFVLTMAVWGGWSARTAGLPKPPAGKVLMAVADDKNQDEGDDITGTYSDVYQALVPFLQPPLMYEERAVMDGAAPAAGAVQAETAAAKEMGSSSDTGDFSGTNVQVEGVDEGDVVKTDGSYIYVVKRDWQQEIRLIGADGSELRKAGTVNASGGIMEFYINGNRLSVISEVYHRSLEGPGKDHYGTMSGQTVLETFDISDKQKPKLVGKIVQDGQYRDSRSSQGYLYLFTSYWPETGAAKKETDRYIPKINGEFIPADCIGIPEVITQGSMMVMSSISWENPGETAAQEAVVTGGETFYVSQDNIYIGSSAFDWEAHQYNYTELLKYSYKDGEISYQARTKMDGSLNNQFSLDESGGYLRVVSTLSHREGKETNSLFIYDEKLGLTGSIEDLAPGERIYSARFMGDMAYFVTYRNMDPLFSADVSDPTNPKVLGELKITGFSQYLHPFSEGLLLGIGQETDPETGNFKGLKLSMFDISSPENVTETMKCVEPSYEYSPAWGNHRAVLISQSKNLVGFAVSDLDRPGEGWKNRFVVYSYEEREGFKKRLSFELGMDNLEDTRGLYIGNYLYIVENDRITAFALDDFSQQAQILY